MVVWHKRLTFPILLSFFPSFSPFLSVSSTDFNTNPQFCSKEIAIYCRDLSKIKYNKGIFGEHSFNNAGEVPGRVEKHNTLHTPRETCRGTNTFCLFFFFFSLSKSYLFHQVYSPQASQWQDSHAPRHSLTYTHATGPQMSTGACSNSVCVFPPPLRVFIFSHSSTEDNKHQQPHIISIGEDTKSSS